MKRTGIFLLLSVVVLTLGYLAWRITQRLEEKKEVKVFTEVLPPIAYDDIQNTTKWLGKNTKKPTVIFFFNTDCEHCQAEAELVNREITQFAEVELYFLSLEPIDTIKTFAERYKLVGFKNLHIGKIDAVTATEKFGIRSFPTVFIYAANGELLKEYQGEVKIEAITNYLN
jgi:thiol-disulfide isomerase/thioredoxin